MKIISYNLRHGGSKGPGNAWQQLEEHFAPDLVFAQESRDPCRELAGSDDIHGTRCLWTNVPDRDWGSAIFSRTAPLEHLSLDDFEGWVTGARIHDLPIGGAHRTVMGFCIHAPLQGSYERVVGKILVAIATAWDRTTPLILAGDFNITTARRQAGERAGNSRGELEILRKMEDLGVTNAWQALHPGVDLPQTLRWSREPTTAYHCDGIFVSASLLPHLHGARIEGSGRWSTASDHNPLIVELS